MRVTYMDHTPLRAPITLDGETILADGAPVVWFTFPGEWHDIGRFHLADGTFTGLYANIITPVDFVSETVWRMTDLFLDVWLGAGAEPRLLDQAELRRAELAGWIGAGTAAAARAEAARLIRRAADRVWPPAVVGEWTLERARAACARGE